jgi:cytochrome c-type biogenesis protein CcmE
LAVFGARPRALYIPLDFRPDSMNARQRRRLAFAIALLFAGGGAAALILFALKDNVLYFYSPSDVFAKHVGNGVSFRIGGLVAPHSVHHGADADVRFTVTDGKASVPVDYRGVLPALFREGQGVVALGALNDGVFAASEVLAKHDERYMPPEVVDALKRSGRWKEGQ